MTCDAQQKQEGCFQVCLDFRRTGYYCYVSDSDYILLDVRSLFLLTSTGTAVHKLVILAGLRASALGTWV